jgi:hypothetical protein
VSVIDTFTPKTPKWPTWLVAASWPVTGSDRAQPTASQPSVIDGTATKSATKISDKSLNKNKSRLSKGVGDRHLSAKNAKTEGGQLGWP